MDTTARLAPFPQSAYNSAYTHPPDNLMTRDAHTRRLSRPPFEAPPEGRTRAASTTARPALISLLAHTRRLVDLLPPLHQYALDVTRGSRSLLFEHNPRNGAMQATSGFGVDTLPTEPWTPAPDEAA